MSIINKFSKSIKAKILSIVVLSSVFILVIAGISISSIFKLNDSTESLISISNTLENCSRLKLHSENIHYLGKLAFHLQRDDEEELKDFKAKYLETIDGLKKESKNIKILLEEVGVTEHEGTLSSIDLYIRTTDTLLTHVIDDDWSFDMNIVGRYNQLGVSTSKGINALSDSLHLKSEELKEANSSVAQWSNQTILVSSLIILIISFALSYMMSSKIVASILAIKNAFAYLSKGVLKKTEKNISEDEVGQITIELNKFVDNLVLTSEFAQEIGKGNFDVSYSPLSEEDDLGNSLIEMKESLQSAALEEQKRSWTIKGMAEFSELLRTSSSDLGELANNIISYLIHYLDANQGGLFVVNEALNANEPDVLELKGCYAYDRQKFINKAVKKGEGLVGQCWIEGAYIYLTDIPQNYLSITSGLGSANPTSLLIVPLKIEDEIYGVVEIASFNLFSEHEIEFVKGVGESIASSLKSVKTNERTSQLLLESRNMAEELSQQEEEMRQNMEEMSATQEQMNTISDEKDREIQKLRAQVKRLEAGNQE